jgi:crotonobetainyl-CoA hydratase
MTSPVQIEKQGQIWIITLDRPKANAIDGPTSVALYEAFSDFENDGTSRVAILTGGGEKFFSAGWDLKAAAEGESADSTYSKGGFAGITEYFDRSKPIIAAVNGLAMGGGFELALACDLIIAADTAEFALPEVTLGLIADAGGVIRLSKALSRQQVLEIAMTGRRISAAEGRELGIINRVVAKENLIAASLEIAQQICAAAPLSVAGVMEIVSAIQGQSVEESYATIRSGALPNYSKIASSEDAQEGISAFAEKRPPKWKGR